MVERIPAPAYDPRRPLQAHVTNLDASPTSAGWRSAGSQRDHPRRGADRLVSRRRHDRAGDRGALYVTEALDRIETDEAGPGEIIAVGGIDEVTIGETLADPDDPRPLPVITVDEPSLSIVIGINNGPLAGRDGSQAHRAPDPRPARQASWSATSRSGSGTPSAPTPGRSTGAASCSSSSCSS